VLGLARNYQSAAVLAAAADLDLFSALSAARAKASELASALGCSLRGMVILLDALTALGLLAKRQESYRLADGIENILTADGGQTVLAMVQHQSNCLRNWAQLAMVVKTGVPAPDIPSVRGEHGDQAAFIGAMHNVSAPVADNVIGSIPQLEFHQVLDLGGASGTWTLAFLRAWPAGRAILFDLPHVIPMARERLSASGFLERVQFVAGDFYTHELPSGADLVWVSAIVHQNSRAQNKALFSKIFRALTPGGRIAIRDILMEPDRTQPEAGALFAVNMLVATTGGGTFTFSELREDLESAGFQRPAVVSSDSGMNSVVVAGRP
jgi:SAM-dependent methyltransferase